MQGLWFALVLIPAVVADPPGTYCTGGPSPDAVPNLLPIEENPELLHVKDVLNGRMFAAQHPDANTSYPVVHLYGSAYDMGVAHGTLLRERCINMWTAFWDFLVADVGSEAQLNATLHDIEVKSAPFVPAAMTQELHGLADATGVSFQRILWIHLYPETADGHCSMFGAWGSATRGASSGGALLQMRALDYLTTDFLSNNHALIVYHPSKGDGLPFVNIGFVGTVSAVTGMSDAPLALSQIGVSNPDFTFGEQRNGQGVPFNFLLREVLQHSRSVSEAKRTITEAQRTIDLILGLGGSDAEFTGVQFRPSPNAPRFYTDTNLLPVNDTWHAPIDNVVYQGMDWLCPGWCSVLGEQLRRYHGNLSTYNTIRYINPIVQTGNLHIAIYEVEDKVLYASFSASSTAARGSPKFAYERPYIRFDAAALMAVKPPSKHATN